MEEKMRIILAGGPSCGKTTTLGVLKKRGYQTVEESAREILNEGKYSRVNYLEFCKEVLNRQLKREEEFKGLAFFDRSALESRAYSRIFLKYIPDYMNLDFSNKYSHVFFLDRLPFENDGIRVETGEEEAEQIHNEIRKEYEYFGYTPIRVPIMTVEQRVNFILNKLKELKGGDKNGRMLHRL